MDQPFSAKGAAHQTCRLRNTEPTAANTPDSSAIGARESPNTPDSSAFGKPEPSLTPQDSAIELLETTYEPEARKTLAGGATTGLPTAFRPRALEGRES